ncbi:MAG: hypothetical protein A2233_01630 [Candidatus Kerfeldbacteria bacterium RIFOXYA2_FULL_38_24]|uniref:Multidrug ABC transporter substrate-binding protein n=1 Tax=Candidatus Kerfeldbacteria bacterium RIFOXYB2_FULL_38_14 TaxID=1798547 RepID=A0A1G2BEJ3_9BACT|nr:MAG: hypothetical protein A2319_04240 [Candidatus Kerfeldbacteria bacterium RIFOXYB2_FULL_38_14]OGY87819.1 MAG: hypothetical protein A2233_01630 [Candidatus Kerfeldbacteria bacterium RIFOXYA2_FULL_38_24]
MKIQDIFQESYTALTVNKARSFLTMLGIIIGIGSVIAMISIGTGAKDSIESKIESTGSNLIYVNPGMPSSSQSGGVSMARGSAQTLTKEDAEAITAGVLNITAVSAEYSTRSQVTATGTNTNTQITGVTSAYAQVHSITIVDGSFITDQQVSSTSKVAVLGATTSEDLFGEEVDVVGNTIRMNNVTFKIVGVAESKGGSGINNTDDMIYVPLSSAQQYLSRGFRPGSTSKTVSNITVQAESAEAMEQVQADVTTVLLTAHGIASADSADFTVMTQADLVSTASSITTVFTTLLAAIAGISLIVGGIGIMNMMLTTVTERTREIGLRKAIGALARDINRQFLLEAVLLTVVGGIGGIVVGWLASKAMTQFASITTQVSFSSVALAFGVSMCIGVVFGYYPAYRASKLNPIDALRFE